MPQNPPSKLTLEIKGLGHVPSFKNRKRICGKRLVVQKDIGERMDRMVRALEFALLSSFRTTVEGTWTAQQLRSWMRSFVPEDDCWKFVAEVHLTSAKCMKGQEGCVITIERI